MPRGSISKRSGRPSAGSGGGAAIIAGGSQRFIDPVVADTTTTFGTSNVYADIAGASRTFTVGAAGIVLVQADFSFGADNAGVAPGAMFLRIVVDGVAAPGGGASEANSAAGEYSGAVQCPVTLAVGAHTIKLQWRSNNATNTIYCRPVTQPDLESCCMVISA